VTRRALQILAALVPYLARLLIWEHLIRRKIKDHEGLQKRYAAELRHLLTSLGPCFIKLGQAVSIRPDLLPAPFLTELQQLCDAVPSFPTKEAVAVIEEELGESVGKLFVGLEGTEPTAAASLGQVYRVRLVASGDEVAVKVQRPDMREAVLRDIFILRQIARAWQAVKATLTNQRPFDVALVDTFGKATLQELDYLNEAANQVRCKAALERRMPGRVYVPKVYTELTTRRVLVTEWIEGPQLAKSSVEVIRRLTPVGVECFLVQLLEAGFFHADPHPGNLLVTNDGRLAIIDFGLVAEVPIQDTKTMTMTLVHLMQGDVPGLVEDAVQLGFLPDDVDRASLTPVLQRVFDSAQLAVTDQMKAKLKFKAIQSRRKQFWAVSADLNRIFYLYPFLVPDYFALITRAMIVLEGIAITGDPQFDLFRAAYPYRYTGPPYFVPTNPFS
jgi:aarF domain-containing kinase